LFSEGKGIMPFLYVLFNTSKNLHMSPNVCNDSTAYNSYILWKTLSLIQQFVSKISGRGKVRPSVSSLAQPRTHSLPQGYRDPRQAAIRNIHGGKYLRTGCQ
jgi:hypothetical protein